MDNQNLPAKTDIIVMDLTEANQNVTVQVESKMTVEKPPSEGIGQGMDTTGCGEPRPTTGESGSVLTGDTTGNTSSAAVSAISDHETGRRKPLFTAALQARIFTVVLMNGIGILAMISEAHIFYRDLMWNRVLDGAATIEFPTKTNTWENKFILFDQGDEPVPGFANEKPLQLTKFLRRDMMLPLISMSMIGLLIIINIVSQTLDMKNKRRYLSWAAGVYAFLGASLLTVGTIQTVLAHEYITNAYGTVRRTLVPHTRNIGAYIPQELPEGDPIKVRDNAEFFYQVFDSCRSGDTAGWLHKSKMEGSHYFKIPSYRQLVQMGFCVNNKLILITMITLALLTGLSWLHVVLCLKTWRKYVVSRSEKAAAEKEKKRLRCPGQEFQREFAMFQVVEKERT